MPSSRYDSIIRGAEILVVVIFHFDVFFRLGPQDQLFIESCTGIIQTEDAIDTAIKTRRLVK